jgi:hypothetical protein
MLSVDPKILLDTVDRRYGGGMEYQPDEGAAFADIPELPPVGLAEVPAPAPPEELVRLTRCRNRKLSQYAR